MNYIGSKRKLLDWIFSHISHHATRLGLDPHATFLDGCTGTGSVAVRAAREGFQVVANDLMGFPRHLVIGRAGLPQEKQEKAFALVQDAAQLPLVDGFFHATYSPAGGRMFFTKTNARRIDAARQFIREVDDSEIQSYLYYCLLEATSKVSNTAGTHGAFLKQWTGEASSPLQLVPCPSQSLGAKAQQGDVLDVVGQGEVILYLDPPYNSRQYTPNYHLYDALVQADDPVVKGKTGLPQDYVRSDFCKAESIVGDLVQAILAKTTARLVLISYSSDGTMPLDTMLTQMMKGFGHRSVELQVREYARYRSAAQDTQWVLSEAYLREYLFIVERDDDGVLSLFA